MPVLMLSIATFLWGIAFTWAKDTQLVMNRAGPGEASMYGPMLMLSVRFFLAGVLWIVLFPAARRGWNLASAGRSILLGGLLVMGLMFQHTGLDRTSAAVSAFLTSLTVLFVPLLTPLFFRKHPNAITWVGVIVATAGVWRMTGATPTGFGRGEQLGLACAVLFAIQLLTLNKIAPNDEPARLMAGQFFMVAIGCAAVLCLMPSNWPHLGIETVRGIFSRHDIQLWMLAMVLLPTLTSFGLMMFFQPKVEPTRAALIYLLEPIWASAYAWAIAGRAMTSAEIQGAALILTANAIVEILGARKQ